MADESSFFVDEELIERLLGGGKSSKQEAKPTSGQPLAAVFPPQIDSPPKPESQKRPVEAQLSSVLVLERDGKTAEALAEADKVIAAALPGKKAPDPYWVKGHLHFEQK